MRLIGLGLIAMLSIGDMAAGQGTYYLNLAREDYYVNGGEPPGRWWGRGAEALRLTGTVEKFQLQRLFDGFSPKGRKLIQNAGEPDHQPGWDLTFSAPKSVSVLWAVADKATRREIQKAHEAAVRAALAYLQDEASLSRTGKGGLTRVEAGLIIAMFEHGTSRALDPQLHTHCLLMNVCTRPDGTTGTLLSKPFYHHKMAAGAIYRAELSAQLERRVGVAIERDGTSFRLRDIPQSVCDFFSKRRAAIEERLGAFGVETARAAAFAALDTREAKDVVPPRRELFAQWKKDGQALGLTPAKIQSLVGRVFFSRTPKHEFAQAFAAALKTITDSHSHFSRRELVRRTAEAAQGRGLDAARIRSGVDHELEHSRRLVRLGPAGRDTRYTTREMFKTEKRLFKLARKLRRDSEHGARATIVEGVLNRYSKPRSVRMEELRHHFRQIRRAFGKSKTTAADRQAIREDAGKTLFAEQAKAVRHITAKGNGRIRFVEGMAGTGKTFMLRAAREVWERAGYTVIGATLGGKAAKGLQQGSGIESITLRQLEFRLRPTTGYRVKHHVKQLVRAARRKKTYRLKPLVIDKNTVVVIDEAGMLGTRQFTKLLAAVHKGGGMVVFIGDPKQLQAIEAGGPFAALLRQFRHAALSVITRQTNPLDVQSVHNFAAGKAHEALRSLAERGLVTVAKDQTQAIERLVADWFANERHHPERSLTFCGTNVEADKINRACQAVRRQAGDLGTKSIALGEERLYEGDRVLFTKISRVLGVNNGDTGTVVAIRRWPETAIVQLDGGTRVVISLRDYRDMRLGYAVTTHKGQGTTTDNAYVLAGGSMQDREISYVQASRARYETRIYASESEAGLDLSGLAKQMSASRAKDLAHDVLEQTTRTRPAFQQTQERCL